MHASALAAVPNRPRTRPTLPLTLRFRKPPARFPVGGDRGWRLRRRRSPTPPSPGSPISRFGPGHAEKNREVCIQRSPGDRHAPYGGASKNAAVILRARSRTKPWRFVRQTPLAIRGRPPAPGRPAARGASRRNPRQHSPGIAPSDSARPAPRPAASENPWIQGEKRIGAERFELSTSWSQTRRATNCATLRRRAT